jgi:Spy/CpxP family protein refolding chaperone
MRKQLLTVLGLVVGTGVALAAFPEGEEGAGPGHRRPGGRDIKAELGLSDAQYAQLRKARVEVRKAAIRRRADLQVARLELRELLDAPTPDEKAVAAKVKELNELQAAALKARVDARLTLGKMLSPEQREKLKEMRGPGRRGRGGYGHRGPRPRRERGGRGPDAEELTEPETE